MPHVLMVSHGGLLRELFIILFDEMGCSLPTDANPGDHKKLSKNTSWSRFQLDIKDDMITKVKCSDLQNAEHLNSL